MVRIGLFGAATVTSVPQLSREIEKFQCGEHLAVRKAGISDAWDAKKHQILTEIAEFGR